MSGIFKEFRDFVLRGNVLDLAVAVVIGAAFTTVVNSLVANVLTPFIAAIIGQPSFGEINFDIGDATIEIGLFFEAVVNFLIVAAVIFFFVIKPVNLLLERRKRGEAPADLPTPEDIQLLREIRDLLKERP
ncbi:large conductance mechanosensitive channel protein MscL [Tepidiforma thermophila]|uniref:Large-conductance mechanosensitive channel n=1 Tax=Tepidiforma thermophila (strain KCTC 52669 / CGMCC 1.13589 / G233) TaxID=2761530 RepID=A0A2A9HB58_TEPT2|nr:large conductance mechanosensitive channel protein MscL [Tepidiforma thermophila]PFG73207.1 large conductance mechanosensitive channel [Tepidiforma thermophila]